MTEETKDLKHVMDSLNKLNPQLDPYRLISKSMEKAIERMANHLAEEIFKKYEAMSSKDLQEFSGGKALQQPFVIDPK